MASKSTLEQKFLLNWQKRYPRIPLETEQTFIPGRKFRADFLHRESRVAIECQGAIWSPKGGHSGGTGIESDYIKFCHAAAAGWTVFPLSSKMIDDPQYLDMIAATILERVEDEDKEFSIA